MTFIKNTGHFLIEYKNNIEKILYLKKYIVEYAKNKRRENEKLYCISALMFLPLIVLAVSPLGTACWRP